MSELRFFIFSPYIYFVVIAWIYTYLFVAHLHISHRGFKPSTVPQRLRRCASVDQGL